MTELRDLIAETLAAHVDVLNRDRSMSCTCGDWLMLAGDAADIIERQAAEHRLHRADAAVAVVAEWLRAEAAEYASGLAAPYDQTARTVRLIKADTLLALADALTQKEPTP